MAEKKPTKSAKPAKNDFKLKLKIKAGSPEAAKNAIKKFAK